VSKDSETLKNSVVFVNFGLSVDSVVLFVGFGISVDSVFFEDPGFCQFLIVCVLGMTLIVINTPAFVLLHPGLY